MVNSDLLELACRHPRTPHLRIGYSHGMVESTMPTAAPVECVNLPGGQGLFHQVRVEVPAPHRPNERARARVNVARRRFMRAGGWALSALSADTSLDP